jgi:hypothetical protein
MQVFSGPSHLFELIGEYEAPLLNLRKDGFKAVFSQKKATGAFKPPQVSGKSPKIIYKPLETGGIFNLQNFLKPPPLVVRTTLLVKPATSQSH